MLLKRDTEKEIVKESMIRWAENIGHTITLQQWEMEKRHEVYISDQYKGKLL